MSLQPILYLKGNPENILPALLIIRKHNNQIRNKEEVERELVEIILGSKDRLPRRDNFIWARLIPPLKNLNLIQSTKDCYLLTAVGKILIDKIKDSDYDFKNKMALNQTILTDFKNRLSRILFDLDKNKCKIIQALKGSKISEFVSIVDLIIKLKELGIDANQRLNNDEITSREKSNLEKYQINAAEGSRLKETLRYYDFAGLIIYRKNQLTLNRQKLVLVEKIKLLREKEELSNSEFFESLYKAYKVSIKITKGHPYVPIIPDVEYLVTYELGITSETFRDILLNFPSVINHKQVLLAPAREAKPEEVVLKRGRVPYYYLAIFEEE